jgi:hypothetical protein
MPGVKADSCCILKIKAAKINLVLSMIVKITVVNSYPRYSLGEKFAITKPLISLKNAKSQDYVRLLYTN